MAKDDWENDTRRLGRPLFPHTASAGAGNGGEGSGAGDGGGADKGDGGDGGDSGGGEKVVMCLGEDGFRRSVLEMADLWTDSIDYHE